MTDGVRRDSAPNDFDALHSLESPNVSGGSFELGHALLDDMTVRMLKCLLRPPTFASAFSSATGLGGCVSYKCQIQPN